MVTGPGASVPLDGRGVPATGSASRESGTEYVGGARGTAAAGPSPRRRGEPSPLSALRDPGPAAGSAPPCLPRLSAREEL